MLEAHLLGGLPDAQAHVVDVDPGSVGLQIVGCLELLGTAGIDDVALAVQDVEQEACAVTDQGDSHVAQLGLGIQGSAVCGEGILDQIGVAHEVGLVNAVEQRQVVQTAGVGEDEIVVHIVGVVCTVVHAGIGPVAVEAQHGDGIGGIDHALGIGGGQDLHKALDVGTVDIVFQSGLVGQLQLDPDMQHFACLDGEGGGLQGSEDQVCIVGIDQAVAAEVSLGGDSGAVSGSVLQDDLGIGGIGQAVAVQVAVQSGGDDQLLGAHGVGGGHGQVGGVVAVVDDAVQLIQLLGEEVTGQAVGLGGVGEVVDGEAEVVDAVLGGIIAQLHLDLAVGGTGGGGLVHQDVGICSHGIGQVSQTGALLQHGVVAAALAVHQGLGGGHQKAGCQNPGAQAGLLGQAVLPDILHQHSRHTGDLGRGHGGTGQVHVGIAGLDLTVDGVDVAAGGSDLRLQLQITGNAPGAELTDDHIALVGLGDDLVGDVHGANIQAVAVILGGSLQE